MERSSSVKPIQRRSPWVPCPAIEEVFPAMDKARSDNVKALLRMPLGDRVKELFRRDAEARYQTGIMRSRGAFAASGSLANFLMKSMQDEAFGLTTFTASTPLLFGLWSAALDDTFTGATTGESAYTSYVRLSLTNNTTIFATGSGTSAYTKTFPSDATKSFAASTGTGTNNTITYLGVLNGNAISSADKGYCWCSVTSTTINSGDTPQLAQNAVSSQLG